MGPLPTYEPSGSSCTDQFTGDLAGGVDRLRVVIGYGDLRFSASSTPPTPMVSLTLDGQDAMPGGTVVSARDVDPTVFVATFPAPARMVNGMSITVHVMQGFDRGPVGSARPSSSQSNAHPGVGHEVRRESDAIAVPIVRARHLCPFLVASAPLGALRCSHSIGGGLYVGYHESAANTKREAAAEHARVLGRRITYDEVLNAEIGGILGDHLLRDPLLRDKNVMRAKFAADASMKLWGCNSGVSGWVYTDVNSTTHTFVSDQNADADYYYWRALNTRNVPKPSVAQALADYFGITVYGAGSGSHIEVQQGGAWITSNKYKKETGRWPGAPQTLRLHPDRGTHNPFKPTF